MAGKSQVICTLKLADGDKLSSSHSFSTQIGLNLVSFKHLHSYCFSPVLFLTPLLIAMSLPPRSQPFIKLQKKVGKQKMYHSEHENWEKCDLNFDFIENNKNKKITFKQ